MKSIHSILLKSVAAASLAATLAACGSYSAASGSGGTTAITGGDNAVTGGTTAGSGGATAGMGGTNAVAGGTTSSAGGANVASGGITTGAGGATVVTGGSTTGTGGGTARTGGSTVVAGGTTTVTGGSAVALGGSTARTGGSTVTAGGTTAGTGGSTLVTGGSPAASGGITTGTGGTTAGTGGSTTAGPTLPCDVLNGAGNKCVSAHSTVRVIVSGYTGPLYQVCKGTAATGPSSCKGTTQDIGSKNGYADSAAQDTFCTGGTCTISKIYDQSGQKNDLEPAPLGQHGIADKPANAADLAVTVNGHAAYGILIKPGMGYRTGCSACNIKTGNGMATGDEPQTMYMITSQKDLVDSCCFDYGNAETTSHDDGNGTMETIYFGGGVTWGTGFGGKPGPWVEADLENGLYAGWENGQDKNISTNTAIKFDFVSAVVLGDTQDKNASKGRFALYGGDATSGTLTTLYDGIRPAKSGYIPMKKQGSIILGIGGDNSNTAGGRFYEGAIATGTVATKATVDALQVAIVGAKYGK
jgi:hypothetical protein